MSRETAITLAFLMDGFNEAHGFRFGRADADSAATYELHANLHGGYVGIVDSMWDKAEWIETYLGRFSQNDFPGVFHYEVTEALGAWIFHHPEHAHFEFCTHAAVVINRWFADDAAAHDLPTHVLGLVPAHVVPASPSLAGEYEEIDDDQPTPQG